ncbi:hypothetical protein [Roseibium sp. MMSF_3544]|uniref:hypothetical protein n=1 Tax=unclassified Roseibium TaxID=2629323 RepID=UPI00273E3E7D|nr:hypothetical protein [Roseibium sp. MMSF_3544]
MTRDENSARRLLIDWIPILFVLVTLGLAWAYLFSVEAHKYATEADTALIRPLCYLLTILAPFVMWTCVHRDAVAISDRPRLTFGNGIVIVAVPAVLAGILITGFASTGAIGGFFLGYFLSGRKIRHALLASAISLVIVVGLFGGLLDVGLPLWPWSD